jgi:4-coumarate--CoA ligase (photoactive yellow protein activation family)
MLSALLHDVEAQAELVEHAHRIAARLGDRVPGRVVVSCKHARSFVPGLLGAWSAGTTVDLLPNVQPGTLDRVDADEEVAYVLHDVAARQGRSSKAVYVPEILSATAPVARSVVTNAWPEIAVRTVTSGTTERPKYVTKSMTQLLSELDVLAAVTPIARCVLSTVPLSHLYGLLWGALLPLRFGARVVSHDALLPADVAAVIEREAVDLMISTPAHLRAMSAVPMPRGLRVVSSGAHLPAELHTGLAMTHDWHVIDVLGSTETGGIATRDQPNEPWTPLPGVKVSAPDSLLTVSSPWCEGSTLTLDDRVDLRADGTFENLGRNSELVKIAGKRAHVHAIEATIRAVPGVTDVALLVHGTGDRESRVAVAIVVAPDGPPVGRNQIAAAVSEQFDPVFVPRIAKVVPRIPRSERGKIDAETLRGVLGLRAAATTSHIPVQRVGPGKYVAVIPRDLVFFRGHFESFVILPGAVLVERLVWPIARTELPENSELRGIRRLRFSRPVFPEQKLSVTVKHDPGRVAFEVSCATSVVATGQLVVE